MANAEQLKTLGRYNIERVLGKGAMGVVYEGVDPRLGRRVAIKTILKSALDEDTGKDFAMRFVREAQAVARLNHPNVVQVFDFGEEGDVAYIVMEFIRGKELKTFFDANERFDLKEAVRIMCELCDALDFAHEAGIIHRDIKPANVMIDSQGRTKLTDFGVARVQDNDKTSVEKTQAGTMVGTPAYMSPEQITGGTIDRRTDVFSAGIILYQFLTGEKPFTGSGAWTIAKKIIQEDPPLPSSLNNAITPVFDAVVNKALAKNVDERFQTARDLGAALKRALEGKGLEDDSDKTVVGGGIIDLDATMKGPAMPSPAAAAKSPTATASAGTQQGSQEVELEFWRAIKDGNDPDDFELYVQQFPNGIYAALAKRKIAKLKGTGGAEDTAKAAELEKKEAAEAARKEAEARTKLAEEKEKLELELAQREEEYKRREAEREAQRAAEEQARQEAIEKAKQEAAAERERIRQEAEAEREKAKQEAAAERERARQEAAAEAEKAKQEAAAALAAEREKAKQEAEKAKLEAAAERERAKAEAEKARLEAEKAKKEAEEKARAEAEQARKEAAAERERAKVEAEKARKEAEEKAKKEADALAKKQAEERAKREAEFKKREADLKAQAAAGGKKASPVVAVIVGVVVLALSGVGYYFFAPDDKAAQEQLKAMQAELKKAQDAQEQARIALDKAKEAEEKAKREGDVAKMKELAEQRARAEAEAKKTADAAKAREADAEKGKESAKVAKEKQEKDKVAAEQKAKEDKAKADKLAADKAAADRAAAEAAAREKAAADKAIADARAAAEKARAEAEKATAEARAAAEKARADAEKAKQEAAAAQERAKVASAAPAASGGAVEMFNQAQALEGQGKGAEAVRLYVRAARGGSGPAAKRLGEIYDKGIDGVSRDYAESLKWRNAARVLGEDVPTAKSRN